MMALAFSGGKDSMACLHLLREELACGIYVETGFTYPETEQMVAYAETLLPIHRVKSDREGQNQREGIPADVVPINWTKLGQSITGPKAVMIQSYLGCCWDNISWPLLQQAKALGVTTLVYGQRADESHTAPVQYTAMIDGLMRLHPIEDWTAQRVLEYLATKMTVPSHYALQHSSLDCYDCTGFQESTRDLVAWTKREHPDLYACYASRAQAVQMALEQSQALAPMES